MYSICQVCGRQYTGINCLRCTQQAIAMQNFGEEALGTSGQTAAVEARVPLAENMAKLKLTGTGQLFAVPKPVCRIGQDVANDIVVREDEAVARFHAQIAFDEKEREYVLRDIGTRFGTFLNENQIHLDAVIFGGDLIRIGKYKFYFETDLDF